MCLIYSTEVSSFFNTIPENTEAFFPSWQEFKNSVAVEIGLLHSQPFTNSHLHSITVESATSRVLLQMPKQMKSDEARSGLLDYWTIATD
jgi:hypothetical protein